MGDGEFFSAVITLVFDIGAKEFGGFLPILLDITLHTSPQAVVPDNGSNHHGSAYDSAGDSPTRRLRTKTMEFVLTIDIV